MGIKKPKNQNKNKRKLKVQVVVNQSMKIHCRKYFYKKSSKAETQRQTNGKDNSQ